jgi:vancomycin permeability regulator SanA
MVNGVKCGYEPKNRPKCQETYAGYLLKQKLLFSLKKTCFSSREFVPYLQTGLVLGRIPVVSEIVANRDLSMRIRDLVNTLHVQFVS